MSRIELPKLAALAGALTLGLSSCALPPDDAWRMIRNEGPLTYGAYEVASRHVDPPSRRLTQRAPSIPYRPAFIATGPTVAAPAVPGLPGYVRSPYAYPPRYVDVAGATPGTVMICPYTQKPFLVPSYFDQTYASASTIPRARPAPAYLGWK